jgi:hypothetical protein
VSCGSPTPPPAAPASPAAPPPSASAAAEPPDDPLPALRTGAQAPVDAPGLVELTSVARHVANGYECIAAKLPEGMGARDPVVSIDAPTGPVPLAFTASAPRSASPNTSAGWRPADTWLWIRRPTSTADVVGDMFVDASGARPGRHLRFHVSMASPRPSDSAALGSWLDGFAESLRAERWLGTDLHVWSYTRVSRLAEALAPPKPVARKNGKGARNTVAAPPQRVRPRPAPRARPGDLAGFIETTTGLAAVQETLQTDRGLWYAAPQRQATVPLASLQPPRLEHHPWADMLARLAPPPPEPLAADVPAEFYYVRAAGLGALLDLLDQADTWGTAAEEVLDDASKERDLALRYETQLALRHGALTRMLGPSVVGEVAVVGSDPYVRDGTDLTLLMRVKQRSLFEAALAATQAELEKDHGGLLHESRDHAGTPVQIARSQDGAVRQQRATVGDVELVSNSPGAMDAVIDAIQGKRPRLSDEADFRFMLARDAGQRADVLAFMGDRFVGEVVGPRQKVLSLRRDDAKGELVQLGYAALLFGLIQGRSPYKPEELVGAGLLAPEELGHASGESIAWQIGSAPRSSWGTPAALTPLIDRPAIDKVSPDEKVAYENFARSYQENFSHYIDPAAVRVTFDAGDAGAGRSAGRTMSVSLRELPLIDQTRYRDIMDFVGASRFTARSTGDGVRLVGGISHESDLRRDVTRMVRDLSGDKLKLDWIGDWAAVGVADRTSIAKVMLRLVGRKIPQMPAKDGDDREDDDLTALATLPLYAEIGIKGPAQVAIALAGLRLLADQTIPGMFDWGEVLQHRDVPVVRVALKGDAAKSLLDEGGEIDVFYAVANGALLVATQQWVLLRLIDERLDGGAPAASTAKVDDSTQLSFDLASGPGKGLWTAMSWIMEREMLDDAQWKSAGEAEMLLRGAPEIAGDPAAVRALSLAYLGEVPVTADGAPLSYGREGTKDPARGSAYAPVWPDIPVPGSPVDKLLRALGGLHTRVAFDDEGKDGDKAMRSLHATAVFDLAR